MSRATDFFRFFPTIFPFSKKERKIDSQALVCDVGEIDAGTGERDALEC
jgi:hypothetical protein